jgi:predicted N-acyltransferase
MTNAFHLQTLGEIKSIGQAAWDACAGPEDPFLSYAFLSSLEESDTASSETGWHPNHVGIFQGEAMVGVVPTYLKTHSEGEFVFDYSWANAYEQAGGQYYPKLQVAVPYTPVPGRRILLQPGTGIEDAQVLDELRQLTDKLSVSVHTGRGKPQVIPVSGLHLTFCPESTFEQGGQLWLQRTGTQFHWHNQ